MDTHMDLYIEHYNDLHNYINDNICKINYNSELLTEADNNENWYTKTKNFVGQKIREFIAYIKKIIFKLLGLRSPEYYEDLVKDNEKLNKELKEQKTTIQSLTDKIENQKKHLNEVINEKKESLKTKYLPKIKEYEGKLQDKNNRQFIANILKFINSEQINAKELVNLINEAAGSNEDILYVVSQNPTGSSKSNYEIIKDTQTIWSQFQYIYDSLLFEIKDKLDKNEVDKLEELYQGMEISIQQNHSLPKFYKLLQDFPNNYEDLYNAWAADNNYFINIFNESQDLWNLFKTDLDQYQDKNSFISYIEQYHLLGKVPALDDKNNPSVDNIYKNYVKESVDFDYYEEAITRKVKSKRKSGKITVPHPPLNTRKQQKKSSSKSQSGSTDRERIDKTITLLRTIETFLITMNKQYIECEKVIKAFLTEVNQVPLLNKIKEDFVNINKGLINSIQSSIPNSKPSIP